MGSFQNLKKLILRTFSSDAKEPSFWIPPPAKLWVGIANAVDMIRCSSVFVRNLRQ